MKRLSHLLALTCLTGLLIGCAAPLDEYGWPIRLEVRHWMRDQLTYDSTAALEIQIERDLDEARRVLGAISAGEAHGIRQ